MCGSFDSFVPLLVFDRSEIHISSLVQLGLRGYCCWRLPPVPIVSPQKKGTNVTAPWPSRIMADDVSQKRLRDEGPLGSTRCIPPSTMFKALSGT